MKSHKKVVLSVLLAAGLVAVQSCKLFFKSDYADLKTDELAAYVEAAYPEMMRRQFAQNQQSRKQIIDQNKRMFSLAQAAEDEGLHKSDRFTKQMEINTMRLLMAKYTELNPDVIISKEELDSYYASHKDQFEADFKFATEGSKQTLTDDIKEQQRMGWSEMKVRAEKARQAGLDKEPWFPVLLKFTKADLLANLYAKSLQEKNKLTDAEKKKYFAEHPEADLEKLREKAQGVLDRLNKGEDFIKLANEFTEDDGKGRGGELPWFAQDGSISGGGRKMDELFTKAAFSLQKGETTRELVKTEFGYHIIRVDDRRMATPSNKSASSPTTPPPSPTPAPTPMEEVLARHIIILTQEAEQFEPRLIQDKVKRAMEDATLKFPVNAPTDFVVKIGGLDPNRFPGVGGGQGGQMRGITPGENK